MLIFDAKELRIVQPDHYFVRRYQYVGFQSTRDLSSKMNSEATIFKSKAPVPKILITYHKCVGRH